MKTLVCAALVAVLFLSASSAKESSPKVQVYSRLPGHIGEQNTLICHVTGFHPPEVSIELLKNNQPMPEAQQTDLAFEENWQYHLTKHVPFTPGKGDRFTCSVTHMGKNKEYNWEPDV